MKSDVQPGSKASLSLPGEYTDEPPRLSVCIDEMKFTPPREGPDAEAPFAAVEDATKLKSADGAVWASEAVQWVVDQLHGFDFADAWKSNAARNDLYDKMSDDEKAEEDWARRVEETFLGMAYGGPDITAEFPKLPEDQRDIGYNAPDISSRMVLYTYQRFQPKHVAWDAVTNDKLWWKGTPSDVKWKKNDDPCHSIWMACQYLASYVNLARGFTVEEHMLRAGFNAGQCGHHSAFADGGGTWFSTAAADEKKGWKFVESKDFSTTHHIEIAGDITPGTIYTFNPYGDTKARFIYAPMSACKQMPDGSYEVDFTKSSAIRVELASAAAIKKHNEDVEKDDGKAKALGIFGLGVLAPVLAPKAGEAKQDYTESGVGNVESVPPNLAKPKEKPPEDDKPVWAKLTFHAQVPGSHIFAVLRRWKTQSGKQVFQVLDTNSHPQTRQKFLDPTPQATQMREYAVWARTSTRGMYCGNYIESVQPTTPGNKFVGFGVMPDVAADKIRSMTDYLKRVRPVGIARLVLSTPERGNPKTPGIPPTLTEDEILYVSRGVLMWGRGEEENFPIAKYLASLRHMPYYKSLQAFWLVYAPRNELARVMFRRGARKKSLAKLVAEAAAMRTAYNEGVRDPKAKKADPPQYLNGQMIKMTTILSNDTLGLARVLWRGNDLTGFTGEGSPPKAIKNLFMDTAIAYKVASKDELKPMERVQRDLLSEYVHKSFVVDEISQLTLPDYLTGEADAEEDDEDVYDEEADADAETGSTGQEGAPASP